MVGRSIGERMTAELVLAAMNMALGQRKAKGVIHHSDQGSQCTSLAFGNRCTEMSVRPSMGTVGDAYDNAMAESFFARQFTTSPNSPRQPRHMRETTNVAWERGRCRPTSSSAPTLRLKIGVCCRGTPAAAEPTFLR